MACSLHANPQEEQRGEVSFPEASSKKGDHPWVLPELWGKLPYAD
jgi:hypothetical protein